MNICCILGEEGNYSCDCNRSLFLTKKYDLFAEMGEFDCGDEIELKAITIKYR